jgi:arginine decarboxylase
MRKDLTAQEDRIDQFFSGPNARADRWRELLDAAQAWLAGTENRASVEAIFADLGATEEFHAYPGHHLIVAVRDLIAADDARATATLLRRISPVITLCVTRAAVPWAELYAARSAGLSLAES